MTTTGTPQTLAEVLTQAAARHPERSGLWHRGRRIDSASLARNAAMFREQLTLRGVGPGARVALHLHNSPAFVALHAAIAGLGAVSVPLGRHLPDDALERALMVSRAGHLVTDHGDTATRLAAKPAPSLASVDVVTADGTGLDSAAGTRATCSASGARAGTREGKPRPDDAATVYLSSGTTGQPKGIRLSHAQVLSGARVWMDCWGFDTRTVAMMVAPFSHVVYAPMVIGTQLAGGNVVVLDRLQVRAACAAIARHRVTALMAPPAFYLQLLDSRLAESADLSSITTFIYGSAPMPASAVRALRQRFPAVRQFNCYGLTETSSAAAVLTPEHTDGREGSVGRPHPGVELTIRDEQGRPLPAGQWGEVCCRGPHVITSYDAAPALDAERFHDAWLRTGDTGRLDRQGFLELAGRIDDVINVAGEKIHASQVEQVLGRHPDVLEAAVRGLPDPVRGQTVAAQVVPRAGCQLDPDVLRRHCSAHLRAAFVPRRIEVLTELPRSPAGKLLRRPAD